MNSISEIISGLKYLHINESFNKSAWTKFIEDEEGSIYETRNLREAMFLTPDGKLWSSSVDGIRGMDHRALELYSDYAGYSMNRYSKNFFEKLVIDDSISLVVPETKTVIISIKNMTDKQSKVLNKYKSMGWTVIDTGIHGVVGYI